jgi:hypothetical protein
MFIEFTKLLYNIYPFMSSNYGQMSHPGQDFLQGIAKKIKEESCLIRYIQIQVA